MIYSCSHNIYYNSDTNFLFFSMNNLSTESIDVKPDYLCYKYSVLFFSNNKEKVLCTYQIRTSSNTYMNCEIALHLSDKSDIDSYILLFYISYSSNDYKILVLRREVKAFFGNIYDIEITRIFMMVDARLLSTLFNAYISHDFNILMELFSGYFSYNLGSIFEDIDKVIEISNIVWL